ncbi:Scm3p SKDI_04G1050 [Saccharomyces kudriavzevii IFO 1802]|uniref:SCM3-like protein n=2 Tax=Saccharomyces kudriavzevii (strain ATCC MYA-4449 / AS 2.2408 / CBS 8840 / NBRC 1802 / NCYC 2889) TaxID=226230 RepID=J8QG09_SACK1|nr:uncharacterized protein SKDI_04G1050 [Saccharomyces kudriavzevii IFO 1802]EJT44604.1 SCM3-like protein [Saccharomyces kudriavzevii IFO 1802]CAI4057353.1 hypothetical protein SKDI_04G1050 [Saccharomyces kudriavzevii IFO 1802]
MKTSKKVSKRRNLKSLHGALKGLLKESSKKSEAKIRKQCGYGPVSELHTPAPEKHKGSRKSNEIVRPVAERNGHVYIMSKENQVIPKLTDDEVMERHKRADENMKEVWSNIISKYESIEDQGDLVDLKTGEIIEDNGHIKKLTVNSTTKDKRTRYTSVLRDIIDISDEEDEGREDDYTIWADDRKESDSDADAEDGNEDEEDEKGIDADFKQYEAKLSKRILRD